jgi:hypothetical protein
MNIITIKATVLLTFLAILIAQAQAQCDVCSGGSFDASLSLGTIPCTDWFALATANTPGPGEVCTMQRAAGVRFCGCATATTNGQQQFDTCYLCGSDASNQQMANTTALIPDAPPNSSLTCSDISEMPIVDDGVTCPLVQEKYQNWCGCPTSVQVVPRPSCPFCEDTGEQPILGIAYPFLDRDDDDDLTCKKLYEWYQVQTDDACADIRQAEVQTFLIDMQAWCECPGREKPKICSNVYCPVGTGIQTEDLNLLLDENTGITCGNVSSLLELIHKPQDCELLLATSDKCCKNVSQITTTTTMEPSSAAHQGTSILAGFFYLAALWILLSVTHGTDDSTCLL